MSGLVEGLKQRPWIAHLLRAVERFVLRLGTQFGAAITYFSVLALVPIVMFAFAVTGFLLTNFRPDLIGALVDVISDALGDVNADTRVQLVSVIGDTLRNYAAIGIFGLLSAIYSGAGWMGNLKEAVRAQWRPDFDTRQVQENFLVKSVRNLVTLLGLIVLIAVTFALAALSVSLADSVVGWLGLDDLPWLAPVLRITPIAVSIGAGWLLFMYLYALLPGTRRPWPVVRRGALIGAVGLAVLQYLTSFLIDIFGGNPAAAIFGPIIVGMLFFNLFAQLILFGAAWIATAEAGSDAEPEVESVDRTDSPPGAAADTVDPGPGVSGVDAPAPARARAGQPGEAGAEPALVPQSVAVRSVRVGMGAGYVTGAATGMGLGAALAYALSAAVRGRRKR